MTTNHSGKPAATNDARKEKILKVRARALAAAPEAETVGQLIEFVRTRIGDEEYGFVSSYVEEVLPLPTLTELPCTPEFVRGMFVLRGEIVSVLDFKPLLGLGTADTGTTHAVVLRSTQMRFGVLVDAVCGVERTWRERVQERVGVLSGMREEYLMGVTEGQVILLDLSRILADRRLVVNERPAG